MEFHFDCVFYYVSDMEAAIRFYRDVLNFRLVSHDMVARFDIDGVLFELVPAGARDNLRAPGNARLCLRVDSVEQALEELRAKSVRTASAVAKGTGVLGSFEDPDGNEICLWQYLEEEQRPSVLTEPAQK
jgi:catechol 2,3-dioxygenase-like lactoylglutathione lyase family enzyme